MCNPLLKDLTNRQDFDQLPDANILQFTEFPRKELRPYLPHLRPSTRKTSSDPDGSEDGSEDADDADGSTVLDLVQRLLVYPPQERLAATEVVKHAWFSTGCPLVLPRDERLGYWLRRYCP